MSEPIRVLWVAKGLGPGGMERLLETHARLGDRQRFHYEAAYVVDRPHSVVDNLEALDVRCHRLPSGNLAWPVALRRLVRRGNFDVVHVHSPLMAALGRPALRIMRRRPGLVYTEHNSWECYGTATRALNALTYALDDAQIAVSDAAATSAPAPLRRSMRAVTHGVDEVHLRAATAGSEGLRAELGIGPDELVVLTVAHLRTEKGYDVWLDAAARVLERRSDVVFLSVGHGPLDNDLRASRDRLGLGDRARFLGYRDDVAALMAMADVLCFASRSEGLPVAYMEASTLGLPTVATAVGGLATAIDDGVSGRLVPPGDPDALGAALLDVLADDERRASMADAARRSADRFDARHAIELLESTYRSVTR